MTIRSSLLTSLVVALVSARAQAAILTVTTTNNVSPGAGETSLVQALGQVKAGDEIRFNIPGPGPHYIATPANGYPLITNNDISINGYSQPGATPNANPILAANTAKLQVVLDSRAGGHTLMTAFQPTSPNDDTGYGPKESAVLGIVDAQGFKVQGLSFLGVPDVGPDSDVALYFLSFARGGSGQISGCWLGVDPDGTTVAGAADGITGFRYRGKDTTTGDVTNTVLINNLVIGVAPKATNAVQQFNVIVGMPEIPIIIEGDNTRISGNFLTVLPDGLHDVDVALDPVLQGQFQGTIEIGRSGNNTLIGTDGDGVNDENERNIFGGMLPASLQGYDHLIEFYSQNPGTNIVFAGNYVGLGVDGKTRFTNGVPAVNGAGASAVYRIGSDFNGISDALEGNVIANNYPATLFPPSSFLDISESLGFFSELDAGATVSLRGNSLINNFPFPASPLRNSGAFWTDYYSKALRDPAGGVSPVLASTSTRTRLKGTVPAVDPIAYSSTVVDVYLADPEGIATGTAAAIPELPQGFVQGLKYLGSFPVNPPSDRATNAVAFDLDISKLNVPAASVLTLTANYIGASGSTDAPTPTLSGPTRAEDGSLTLTWSSGSLQSASEVIGPWTDETTTGNSLTFNPTEGSKFFRVKGDTSTATSAAAPLTSPFSNALTVQ